MRPKGSPEELERRRVRAVQLLNAGESPEVVSRILGVTRTSLYRWRRRSRQRNGLRAKPASGRPRRLSDRQLKHLERLLRKGPQAHGWSNQLWTAKRVAALIFRHFGILYHPEHVRKLLKHRLHWSSQKPQRRARERNDKEVDRWIADEWPRIFREAFKRHAHIGFLDESGFLLTPLARRTLAPRGQTPIMRCSVRHDRISVLSMIALTPQARRVSLHCMLLPDNENFHGEEVVEFLCRLKQAVPGPWTIVWDRNQIHSKARVVRAWLSKHPEVVVEDFPANAPDTNPDEEVWCWAKYDKLCNLAPADVAELRGHVLEALAALKQQPGTLISFIVHARVPLAF